MLPKFDQNDYNSSIEARLQKLQYLTNTADKTEVSYSRLNQKNIFCFLASSPPTKQWSKFTESHYQIPKIDQKNKANPPKLATDELPIDPPQTLSLLNWKQTTIRHLPSSVWIFLGKSISKGLLLTCGHAWNGSEWKF
jgi:hypothetical protein